MNSLHDLIQQMVDEKRLVVRQPISLSWGNKEVCHQLFISAFLELDKTIIKYQHLPEYEEIIEWMTNSEGKGLMLMGDCGRGKSIIITGIIPLLFRINRRLITPVHSQDFSRTYPLAPDWQKNPDTNLEYLLKSPYPIIDELGVETLFNNYGEKSEGFNQIINSAERYLKPLFVTTNLTKLEILDRYGERTMDRLSHLCKVIKFSGESLR